MLSSDQGPQMKSNLFLPASLMVALATWEPATSAAEPTGASLAFTSHDPLVVKAMDLMQSGKFHEAENVFYAHTGSSSLEIMRAQSEAIEIIRRTRYEYSLDAEA